MVSFGLISSLLFVAGLAVYLLGRNSYKVKELKKDVETSNNEIEILEKQRDGGIDNADSADAFWMQHGRKKD